MVAIIGGVAPQPYPSRPITMIALFLAGVSFDALARALAEPLQRRARPADGDRECRGRGRQYRHRPARARRA